MAVVNRNTVAAPTLPKETVEVEALGGEVIVRGLLLTERLALESRLASAREQAAKAVADGNTKAAPSVGEIAVPALLTACVLDAEGKALWTEEQWQAFGCRHQGQALALFNVAWRLSGFEREVEAKN